MVVHLPLLLMASLGLQDSADPAPRGSGRFVPTELRAPVHYESVNGLIFFKANVAGREVWANLDTGAPTLIDLALTRSAGLSLAPGEEKLRTVDGEVALRWLSGEVAIVIPGQIETSHPRLGAVDMSAISKMAGREVRLVVGHDFLKPLALLIDPTRKVFQFAPSGAFRPPPGAVEVSLEGEKIPRIEVTVGTEKAIVTIDTGSMGNLALAADAWARLVPKDSSTRLIHC